MESDEKLCPKCAEPIKCLAVVCKHCGASFEGPAAPSHDPEQAKKHRLRNGCLGIVAAMIGLSILGAVANKSQPSSSNESAAQSAQDAQAPNGPQATQAMINAVEISAKQLEAAYNANEAAAQQQYGDATLLVYGTVNSINLDFVNKTYLVLSGANMFLGPQAELSDESAKAAPSLHKGQKVKLLCSGKTQFIVGTVHMSGCELQ